MLAEMANAAEQCFEFMPRDLRHTRCPAGGKQYGEPLRPGRGAKEPRNLVVKRYSIKDIAKTASV